MCVGAMPLDGPRFGTTTEVRRLTNRSHSDARAGLQARQGGVDCTIGHSSSDDLAPSTH